MACVVVFAGGIAGPPIPNDEVGEPLSSCAIRFFGGEAGVTIGATTGFDLSGVEAPNVPVCFGVTTTGVTGLRVLEKVPELTLGIDGFVLATLPKVDFETVNGFLISGFSFLTTGVSTIGLSGVLLSTTSLMLVSSGLVLSDSLLTPAIDSD